MKPDRACPVRAILTMILLLGSLAYQQAGAQSPGFSPLIPEEVIHNHNHEATGCNHDGDNPPAGSTCPNSNFNQGDFLIWDGCWGNWDNGAFVQPCDQHTWSNTPNGGHFTIIAAPGGPDPNIPALNTVFPGEAFVARLGNVNNGGYVDQLKYQITVAPGNNFFIYRFAVVLSDITDPTHNTPDKRPRFTIEIRDPVTGTLLDPTCGFYDVYPGDGQGGWNNYNDFVWKDWNTVGMDISAWNGQQIDIVFTTHGCAFSAHPGYAYISAFCSQMTIDLAGCEGSNQVTMTGPPGFAQYSWEGPKCATCPLPLPVVGTTQSVTITNAVTGHEYYLNLTAFNGCMVNKATSVIQFTDINAEFNSSINCIGNPSTFTDVSVFSQNATDQRIWDFGDGSPPVTINTPTINHTFALAGNYDVKLIRTSTDPCIDSVIHTITVATQPPTITNTLMTKEICSGQNAGVALEFSQAAALASWTSAVTSGSATINNIPPTQSGAQINDIIVNTGTGDAVVTYTLTPFIGDCIGLPVTYTVTVHPLPVPAITGPAEACDESAGHVYATEPSMTNYTWTITGGTISTGAGTQEITVSWTTPGNQQLTVNYTDSHGCSAASPSGKTVTVHPNPVPSFITGSTQVCVGASNTVYSTETGMTGYIWTVSAGGIITAGSGTASIMITWNTAGSGTDRWVEVNYTDAEGCTALTPSRVYVTVKPVPNVVATPPTLTTCSGQAAQVQFASEIPGTTGGTAFNWTASAPVSIVPSTLAGSGDINQPFTNSSTTPQAVTFSVVSSNNGCSSSPFTYQVTVNPVANVIQDITSQYVCTGGSSAQVHLSSAVTGTAFSWTVACEAGILSPCPSGGTGNTIGMETIINTISQPQNVNYLILPTFGNCPGTSSIHTVTVNPAGQVNDPANQVTCNGTATGAVVFGTVNTGGTTTYSWTNDTPSIGLAAAGTGNIASFTSANTSSAPVTATVTIVPHYTNGTISCDGPSETMTFTVNPSAQVNQPANQAACNGDIISSTVFTTDRTGGITTFAWINDNPSIGLVSSGNGDVPSFTATNNGSSPVTATLTVTPSYSGSSVTCSGNSKTYTITVNPTAQVNQPANQVICNGGTQPVVSFSSTNTGGTTTYTWTNDNISIGLAASGTGDLPSFTALNPGSAPVTATITVLPTFTNGSVSCPGPAKSFTLTVNPTAQVNQPADQVICNGEYQSTVTFSTGNTGGTTTYTWTNDNTSIGLAATGSGDLPSFTAINNSSAPVTATITIVPSFSNGSVNCTGPAKTFTITVNPTAQVNQPVNQVLCNGGLQPAVAFTTASTGGVTTYAWTNDTPSIGLMASGTGDMPSFTAVNSSMVPVTATVTVVANFSNGSVTCSGPSKSFTITVNPTANVIQPPDQVVCDDGIQGAVVFSSGNSGGTTTYSWTNSLPSIGLPASGSGNLPAFTAVNNGTAPVTATIVVSPTFLNSSVSCTGPSASLTITVNPTAQVNQPTDQVICNGGIQPEVPFSTNNTDGVTTYTWTNDNPAIGLAPSGSGNLPAFSAVNNGNMPVVATITVTPHFLNRSVNCDGPSKTFTVTVNPTAQVDQPVNQVVCNAGIQPAVLFSTTNTGGTTTYAWSNDNPSIGLAASGTGDLPSFPAVNGTTDPVTATITILPTFSNGSVNCSGPAKTFTITVNPTAQVNQPANQVVCNGAVQLSIPFSTTSTGGVTTYTWSNNLPAVGLAANGTGNIPSFTAVNGGTAPVIATIIVTPVFANGLVNCPGPAKTFTITVNPTAQVNQPGDQFVCNGGIQPAVAFNTGNSGGITTYSWMNDTPSIGLPLSGTGDLPSFTAINGGLSPVTAIITVNPLFLNASVSCTGPSKTFSITVNPTAEVNQPASHVVCNGSAQVTQPFMSANSGGVTSYSWTNDTPSIGLSASGSGDIPVFTAINGGTSAVTATIVVFPTFTNGTVSCPGPSKSFTITVNPTAQVNQPANQVICNGGLQPAVPFVTVNTGGNTTYSWTNNTPSIGLAASGAGDLPAFTASNNSTMPVTAIITVTPSFSGGMVSCSGPAKIFTITVNPTAQVIQPLNQVVCNSGVQPAVNFATINTGGITTYTWSNDNISIGLAPSGSGNLPSFTAINGGLSPVTATITVQPTFSNGLVNCTGPAKTFTITINPTAQVNQPASQVICNGGSHPAIPFTTGTTGGVTSYTWTNDTPSIGLPASGTGDIPAFNAFNGGSAPVTATITVVPDFTSNSVNCTGPAKTFTITVNPTAQVNQPSSPVICNGGVQPPIHFSTVNSSGTTTYAWTNDTPGIGLASSGNGNIPAFTATNNGLTPVMATITVTPSFTNNGVTCTGPSKVLTITVNPTAQVDQPGNQVICNGNLSAPVSFTTQLTGGTSTYSWTNDTPGIGLPAAGSGNLPEFTALNTGNSPVIATLMVAPVFEYAGTICFGPSKSFTFTVQPTPHASCILSQPVCSGAPTAEVDLVSTVAGTDFSWSANCPVGSLNPCPIAPGTSDPIPSMNFMNLTDIPQTITFTINSSYAGCPGSPATHTVTVNPSPTVINWPLEQTICSGLSSNAVSLQSTVAGTTFSWTATASGPVTGFTTTGTDQIPAQTLYVPAGTSGFVTYHIIPSFTGGTSCPGAPTDYKIFVNPLPTPAITGPVLVCELQPGVKYNTPSVPGHSYSWTVTGATTVSGASSPEVTVTWGPYTSSPGTLTITETIDATGCIQSTSVYNVTLQRRPIPDLTGPVSVCDGSTGKVYQTEAGMTNYTWTVTGGTITSGGGAGNNTATVTWNSTGLQTVEVNYYNSLNCPGFPAKVLPVTVHPLPVTTISEGSGPNCEGTSHSYSVPADPSCTYTWSVSPASRGFITGGQGTAVITVSWSSFGTANLGVTAVNNTTTCVNNGAYTLEVHPKPLPSFTPCFDALTTSSAKKFTLRGANPYIPGQGVFSGTRVIFNAMTGSYEFDPFGAPAGSYPVTYTFTNTYGCTNSALPVTIVIQNPSFSCGGILTDIRDGKVYQTVALAGKCWMKENLAYGSTINNPGQPQADNCIPERFCSPDDLSCDEFGGFYQWDELLKYGSTSTGQGLCPPEWHVPSETEWQTLIDNVLPGISSPDANALAGGVLKDASIPMGFLSLLAGMQFNNSAWSYYSGTNQGTMYWTSTPAGAGHAVARGLNIFTPSVSKYTSPRNNAFQVRCIRD